jgi:hypothetical protein
VGRTITALNTNGSDSTTTAPAASGWLAAACFSVAADMVAVCARAFGGAVWTDRWTGAVGERLDLQVTPGVTGLVGGALTARSLTLDLAWLGDDSLQLGLTVHWPGTLAVW